MRIQLFGDSTNWGEAPLSGGQRATPYPETALQTYLDAQLGAGKVVVSTRAVGGTTSAHLVTGTDGTNSPWPQSVKADILLVNHGINDGLLGVTEDAYAANLATLAMAPAVVIFETPLPVIAGWVGAKDYAPIMRAAAAKAGVQVIDTAAFAVSTPNWYGRYAQDGIHPNGLGYQLLVTEVVGPALLPVVKKAAAAQCPR